MLEKFLFYPVEPLGINQPFGVNPATYAQFNIKGHNGIDFRAVHGQPVRAAHDGMAYWEVDDNQGCGVVIRSDKTYDYNGEQTHFKTIYWHLCASNMEPAFVSPVFMFGRDHHGAPLPVKTGDIIGFADNTGFSTGDHLHFGLKPQAMNEDNGVWYNTEQNNGFAGAIDPQPFFNGHYASQVDALEKVISQTQVAIEKVDPKNAEQIDLLSRVVKGIADIFKKLFTS